MTDFASALEVPKLKGYVNDYAQMLTSEQAQKLERDLELDEAATSNQIFILTIPTLEGEVLEQFSIKVADAWKAGQKKKDNGVIILLVKNEKKIRLEVGLGLQGKLTDLIASRIIQEEMEPRLKKGDALGALQHAVEKIKLSVKGEYKGDGKTAKGQKKDEEGKFYLTLVIFFLIAGIASFVNVIIGGIVGAVLAPTLGFFLYHVAPSILVILVIVGFIAGLVARLVLQVGLSGGGGGFGGGGGGFDGGGSSGSW